MIKTAAFCVEFDELVGQEDVGREPVSEEMAMEDFSLQIGFLVYIRLQEIGKLFYSYMGDFAFHASNGKKEQKNKVRGK